MNGVTKSLAKQMFYLGVPKIYRIPFRVMADSWDGVPGKIKVQITAKTNKIAHKITAKKGRAKPGFKTKFMFTMMRSFQKKNDYALLDKKHWEDRQWLGKKRPWT